jgi:hypothetical protein
MPDRRPASLSSLVRDSRRNAVLTWALIAVACGAAVTSLWRGNLLWTGFAVVVAGLAAAPSVTSHSPQTTFYWPVVAIASLPVLGRALASNPLTGAVGLYLSVAALALLLAAALQTETAVRMTPAFAVGFVVATTLATAGIWAVVRWSAASVGIAPFGLTHDQLMWEFVASAVAGSVAGVLFPVIGRRGPLRRRLRG